MTHLASEPLIISLSDIWRIFKRNKKALLRKALLCTLAAFIFFLLQEPQYEAKASFKHSAARGEQMNLFKNFLKNVGIEDNETGAISLMLSRDLIRVVVQEMGLQMQVKEQMFLTKAASRIWNNLLSEARLSLSELDLFEFREVLYSGEKPLSLFLQFSNSGSYTVFNQKKEILGYGQLKEKIEVQGLEFILEKTPKNLSFKKHYPLRVSPWSKVVEKLGQNFSVKRTKIDKNVLELKFQHRNRHHAAEFLNKIMTFYQIRLKDENEQICSAQMAYLEKRQEELSRNLDKTLEEHCAYLKKNLADNGFIDIGQEIEILTKPKEEYQSKIFEYDLELKRLQKNQVVRNDRLDFIQNKKKGACQNELCFQNEDPAPSRDEILADPLQKKCEENLLALDLLDLKLQSENEIFSHLKAISEQKKLALRSLKKLEKGEELGKQLSLIKDPKGVLQIWSRQIQENKNYLAAASEDQQEEWKQKIIHQEKRLKEHLKSLVHNLEFEKNKFQQTLLQRQAEHHELQGINLEAAQALNVAYNNQLDEIQAQIHELLFLRDKLENPLFELSSLGIILTDSVSQEILQKASHLALQLKDEGNRTRRDQERLKEELETQKKFLDEHMEQILALKKLRAELIQDKIAALQEVSIGLIKNEKELLNDKLQEIHTRMGDFPEKWRRGNYLKLKAELSKGVMEGMTHLVESKNVNQHLYQVESRPLDPAIAPLHPRVPMLIPFSCAMGALGFCVIFLVQFFKQLMKGLPLSLEGLKMHGYPTAGELSRYCDCRPEEMVYSDLQTLRNTCSFIISQKKPALGSIISLIGGKHPNYSHALAHLLSLQGSRVLLIQASFDRAIHPDEKPGLWQYLNNEITELPIRSIRNYHFVPTGGTDRHAAERLASEEFILELKEFQKRYDYILLFSSFSPDSAESKIVFNWSDGLVITIGEENLEQLKPFWNWSEKKQHKGLTFLSMEEA